MTTHNTHSLDEVLLFGSFLFQLLPLSRSTLYDRYFRYSIHTFQIYIWISRIHAQNGRTRNHFACYDDMRNKSEWIMNWRPIKQCLLSGCDQSRTKIKFSSSHVCRAIWGLVFNQISLQRRQFYLVRHIYHAYMEIRATFDTLCLNYECIWNGIPVFRMTSNMSQNTNLSQKEWRQAIIQWRITSTIHTVAITLSACLRFVVFVQFQRKIIEMRYFPSCIA